MVIMLEPDENNAYYRPRHKIHTMKSILYLKILAQAKTKETTSLWPRSENIALKRTYVQQIGL